MTIGKNGLSKSTPGCATCSSNVMRVIREERGLHLQSLNRVLALSHCGTGTVRVYPWMHRILPKGHVDFPQGSRPLSSIIESSMYPVFDYCENGTLKVTPGYAACSSKVMQVIHEKLGLHLESSNRVLAPSLTIAEKGLSESTPGYAAYSPRVIWVVHRELGLHLQSSIRVLALSLTIAEKRLQESTPRCAACSPRVMM